MVDDKTLAVIIGTLKPGVNIISIIGANDRQLNHANNIITAHLQRLGLEDTVAFVFCNLPLEGYAITVDGELQKITNEGGKA